MPPGYPCNGQQFPITTPSRIAAIQMSSCSAASNAHQFAELLHASFTFGRWLQLLDRTAPMDLSLLPVSRRRAVPAFTSNHRRSRRNEAAHRPPGDKQLDGVFSHLGDPERVGVGGNGCCLREIVDLAADNVGEGLRENFSPSRRPHVLTLRAEDRIDHPPSVTMMRPVGWCWLDALTMCKSTAKGSAFNPVGANPASIFAL